MLDIETDSSSIQKENNTLSEYSIEDKKSLKEKIFKVRAPLIFVNIGGITNVTCFVSKDNLDEKMLQKIFAVFTTGVGIYYFFK